jgi:DNA-directed RNA polymerase subunit RPC12/RpoP
MPDGKHCPACGRDVGYWAVARGLFRIRCPHCGARLCHRLTPRMNAVTTAVATAAVFAALVPGYFAAEAAFRGVGGVAGLAGGVAALAAGVAVWVGVAFGLGFVFQLSAAPLLRRTQRLIVPGEPETPAEEETW